jgi:hypothetical protein
MTTDERQKADKAASDKIYFLKMVEFHKKESEHYLAKANACDPNFSLAAAAPSGSFGGL